MRSLNADIATKAKDVGGDAVILLDEHSGITGGFTTQGGEASFHGSHFGKYAVIQYLDDEGTSKRTTTKIRPGSTLFTPSTDSAK